MVFLQERGRLATEESPTGQSKLGFTVHRVQRYFPRYTGYWAIFPRKSKTKNQLVKIIVNGTQGTMVFSQETV